jgi:hypothetical protein
MTLSRAISSLRAKRGNPEWCSATLDGFVASLLAMTVHANVGALWLKTTV